MKEDDSPTKRCLCEGISQFRLEISHVVCVRCGIVLTGVPLFQTSQGTTFSADVYFSSPSSSPPQKKSPVRPAKKHRRNMYVPHDFAPHDVERPRPEADEDDTTFAAAVDAALETASLPLSVSHVAKEILATAQNNGAFRYRQSKFVAAAVCFALRDTRGFARTEEEIAQLLRVPLNALLDAMQTLKQHHAVPKHCQRPVHAWELVGRVGQRVEFLEELRDWRERQQLLARARRLLEDDARVEAYPPRTCAAAAIYAAATTPPHAARFERTSKQEIQKQCAAAAGISTTTLVKLHRTTLRHLFS